MTTQHILCAVFPVFPPMDNQEGKSISARLSMLGNGNVSCLLYAKHVTNVGSFKWQRNL